MYALNFIKTKNFNFPENFAKFSDFSLIFLTVFRISLIFSFVTTLIYYKKVLVVTI